MRRTDPQSIGEIKRQAMEAAGATEAYDLQRVCTLWPEIVGPTINRFTTRRWIDRDVLHVAISSAALRNDLMFHRERLIAHLNRAAGKNIISNIIFH